MVRFVISMTTLPGRVQYIKPVIDSILRHNGEIDKLYICLPRGKVPKHHIPPNTRKVEVIRCKDYGPITKIVGVLDRETDPDTLILTLDDDIIVTKNIVRLFRNKARKYPDAALSMSGWCYGSYPFNYQIALTNKKDVPVDWIQGVHGILYHRSFLDKKELLRFERHNKLLFKNDDHKIAAYLESKGINRISINKNPVDYLKDYGPASGIDPISGGSFFKNLEFWKDIKTISEDFKERGYYYRCYSCTQSTVFLVGIFVFLGILIILAGWLLGYKYDLLCIWYFVLLVLVAIIILFCLFHYHYKKRYILTTTDE